MHCEYRSIGDLVTGEPVSILLYLASLPSAVRVFVRLAFGFLITVDSSTARRNFLPLINADTYRLSLSLVNASTFTTKILRPLSLVIASLSSVCCFLLGDERQVNTSCLISSGK